MMKFCRAVLCGLSLASLVSSPVWGGCVTPVGASGSNPNSRYIIGSTGQEVYDTVTDITWQRCPYGWFLSLDHKSCVKMQGSGDGWSQRLDHHGNVLEIVMHHLGPPDMVKQDWIIPSQGDLKTLIDNICKNPAINQEVFPNTPPTNFWGSNSKGVNSHGHEFLYVVNFAGDGSTDDHEDANRYQIRLRHKGKGKTASITYAEERNLASPQQ